ncbi:MAG: hypothetical protein L6R41_007829 [Letrouitia leprolyta]|nr:MAG: hypothetical protein L6R41_007829 [Letrouitia leprolyta]
MSSKPSQDEPLPVPPFVPVEGMFNLRDIGGYEIPTIFGRPRSIRRGLIYRGGEPSRITPAESTGCILELLRRPIVEVDGIERIHIDIWAEAVRKDGNPTAQDYQHFKKNSLERFIAKGIEVFENGTTLRPIFDHLAKPNPSPVYLHCTAGKDRTGTVVLLLFRLAGVSPELAAEEYELTNLGLREEGLRLVELVLKSPQMNLDAESLKNLGVAKKEYIEELCKVFDKKYGGAEQYFKHYLKMTAAEMKAIKRNLTVNERTIFRKRTEPSAKLVYQDYFMNLPLVLNNLTET